MKKKTSLIFVLILILILITSLTIACTVEDGDEDVCNHPSKTNCVCDTCGEAFHNIEDCVCTACGEEYHEYDDLCTCITCGKQNHQVENCLCKVCKASVHRPDDNCLCKDCGASACNVDENCYCEKCEEYFHISNGLYCRHGDKIYYGYYPQSQITDTLIATYILTETGLLGKEPNAFDGSWSVYDYYDEGIKGYYALYKDVEVLGERFRVFYTKKYRPHSSELDGTSEHSTMDDVGVELNKFYLFHFDPIEWLVLEEDEDSMLIQTTNILDNQGYQDLSKKDYEKEYGAQVNYLWQCNWETSTLRSWLNEHFYNSSFGYYEKKLALTQTINNESAEQANTKEKVSLLDEAQVEKYLNTAEKRQKTATPYALAQGFGMSNLEINNVYDDYQFVATWSLRTPKETMPQNYERRFVSNKGNIFTDFWSYDISDAFMIAEYQIKGQLAGVAPVMKIRKAMERVSEKEYTFTVKDDDGNPISGIKAIFSSEEGELGTFTTNDEGVIKIVAPDKQVISIEILEVEGDYTYKNKYKFASKQYNLNVVFGIKREYTIAIKDTFGDLIGGAKIKLSDGKTMSEEYTTNEEGVVKVSYGFESKNVYALITGFKKTIYLWNSYIVYSPNNDRYEKYAFDDNRQVEIVVKTTHPYNGYEIGDCITVNNESLSVSNQANNSKSWQEFVSARELAVMFFYNYYEEEHLEILKLLNTAYSEIGDSVAVYTCEPNSNMYVESMQWMLTNNISYDYGHGEYSLHYSLSQNAPSEYPMWVILDKEGHVLAYDDTIFTSSTDIVNMILAYLEE